MVEGRVVVGGNFKGFFDEIDKSIKKWQAFATAEKGAADQGGRVVTSLRAIDKNLNKIGGKVDNFGTKSKAAFDKAERGGRKTKDAINQANESTKSLTVSFATFGRLAAFQLASRAISTFVQQLNQAVISSIELEKRISSIRTISTGAQVEFNILGKELQIVADEFNVDIVDQATAAYAAISNQVSTAADVFPFLTAANKLAVTGLSTSTQAISLLSSTINAFKLDVADAEVISGKLFRTVELGRILIPDLADSFGTVAVAAQQVGVSLDEVLGALATLTRQGIKPAQALTFLRNGILKLINPTTVLQETLEELGFTSGQQAVQVLGFAGVLDQLGQKAAGSSKLLFEFFGRIRGAQLAFGVTGENAEEFANSIDSISKAGADFNTRFGIAVESTGFKLEKEFTKISNFFTNILGREFSEVLLTISKTIGGFSENIEAFATTIKLLAIPATVALIAVFVSLASKNPFVALAAGALLATQQLIKFQQAAERLEGKNLRDLRETLDRIEKDALVSAKKTTKDLIKEFNTRNKAFIRTNIFALREITNRTTDLTQNSKQLNKDIIDANKRGVTSIKNTLRDINNEIRNSQSLQNSLTNTIGNLQKQLGTIDIRIGFNKLNIDQQATALIARLETVRKAAEDAFQSGNIAALEKFGNEEISLISRLGKISLETVNDIAAVQDVTADALKRQIQQAQILREEIEGRERKLQEDRIKFEESLNQKRIANEEILQAKLGIIKDAANIEQVKALEKIGEQGFRRLLATVSDPKERSQIIKGFEDLVRLSDQKIAKIRGAANTVEINNAQRLVKAQGEITTAARASATAQGKFTGKLKTQFGEAVLQLEFVKKRLDDISGGALTGKESDLQALIDSLNNFKAKPSLDEFRILQKGVFQFKKLFEIPIATTLVKPVRDVLRDTLSLIQQPAVVGSINALADSIKKASEEQEKLNGLTDAFAVKRDKLDRAVRDSLTRPDGAAFLPDISEIQKELKLLETGVSFSFKLRGIIPAESLTSSNEKLKTALDENTSALKTGPGAPGDIRQGLGLNIPGGGAANRFQLPGAVRQELGLVSFPNLPVTAGVTPEDVDKAQRDAEQAKLIEAQSDITAGFNIMNTALTGFANAANFSRESFIKLAVTASQTISQILIQLATATGNAQLGIVGAVIGGVTQLASGNAIFSNKGGLVPKYFAEGGGVGHPGEPSGQDTVAAWLTPGEFVMNKQATQQHFPLLKALNSKHFAEGGPVSGDTTTVGDINVNLTTSGGAESDAIAIGRAINREIQRGTLPNLTRR